MKRLVTVITGACLFLFFLCVALAILATVMLGLA